MLNDANANTGLPRSVCLSLVALQRLQVSVDLAGLSEGDMARFIAEIVEDGVDINR